MSAERDVRYADSGGVQIAYEVIGDGPIDIVMAYDWASNIDLLRMSTQSGEFMERIAEFSRLILFDMRGVGLSDPVDQMPSLEVWVDDIQSVMDAVGSERAALVGNGQAAQLALLFAAMHPRRATAVVTVNGFACLRQDPSYPCGFSPEGIERAISIVRERWGAGEVLGFSSPDGYASPGGKAWLEVIERSAGSPRRAAIKQQRAFEVDVRDVLSAITVPTLVAHSRGNRFLSVDHAEYLVAHIDGARYLELAGNDHVLSVRSDGAEDFLQAMEAFLTGHTRAPVLDRALRTVAFTDIVDSTRRASELGDKRWRGLLETHESIARREVESARGSLIKFTGDGLLATFDGPARAVKCLQSLGAALDSEGLPIRAGIHTGEVELIGDDIGGIAVHIAARISAKAGAGEILTSSTVRDLVAGSGLEFDDRGEHELKGVPGTWRILATR